MTQRSSHKPIQLISDLAIAESDDSRKDALEFSAYADVIARTVRGTRGPFTIGVFGEWGMGKTSLMRLVEKEVGDSNTKDSIIIPVWFNAWMFERVEYPVIPLIKTIVKALKENETTIDKLGASTLVLIDSLEALVKAFKLKGKLSIPSAEVEVELDSSKISEGFSFRRKKRSLVPENEDSYEQIFEALNKINEKAVPRNITIMVLIDDLDRCFPENAVRLLENIKLILSQPGFIFLLGASRDVIEGYLQSKYKKQFGIESFDGRAYLDKMIQLTFDIPPHAARIDNFTVEIVQGLQDRKTRTALKSISSIISEACQNNPRTIIRFVNRLITDNAIYEQKSADVDSTELPISMFAVTRSLQQRWRDVYGYLVDSGDVNEDREYCEIVSNWSDGDIVDWSSYDPLRTDTFLSNGLKEMIDTFRYADAEALKQIALYLRKDRILKSLLQGNVGRKWLTNHVLREASISFLTTQPLDDPTEAIFPSEWSREDNNPWPNSNLNKDPAIVKRQNDDMYNEAVRTVVLLSRASTSLLQRKLRIGYARAARIIEQMEENGIVGPADGARPREVLIKDIDELKN